MKCDLTQNAQPQMHMQNCIDSLVHAPCMPLCPYTQGSTPVHAASREGDHHAVRQLIQMGLSVHDTDEVLVEIWGALVFIKLLTRIAFQLSMILG